MKKVCALLLALFLVLSLVACGGNNVGKEKQDSNLNSQLVGKWVSESGETTIEFFKDGSCLYPSQELDNSYNSHDHQLYTAYENGSIVFAYYGNGVGDVNYETYNYAVSDDSLTIDRFKFKKQ